MPPVDNPGGPALVNVAFYELDPETVGCLIPVVPEHHPNNTKMTTSKARFGAPKNDPQGPLRASKQTNRTTSESTLDIPTSFNDERPPALRDTVR
jgi:hypothetical protein